MRWQHWLFYGKNASLPRFARMASPLLSFSGDTRGDKTLVSKCSFTESWSHVVASLVRLKCRHVAKLLAEKGDVLTFPGRTERVMVVFVTKEGYAQMMSREDDASSLTESSRGWTWSNQWTTEGITGCRLSYFLYPPTKPWLFELESPLNVHGTVKWWHTQQHTDMYCTEI